LSLFGNGHRVIFKGRPSRGIADLALGEVTRFGTQGARLLQAFRMLSRNPTIPRRRLCGWHKQAGCLLALLATGCHSGLGSTSQRALVDRRGDLTQPSAFPGLKRPIEERVTSTSPAPRRPIVARTSLREAGGNGSQRFFAGEMVEEAATTEEVDQPFGPRRIARGETGEPPLSQRASDFTAKEAESFETEEDTRSPLAAADSMPFRLEDDALQFFPSLWEDTMALGNWPNVIILGAAAGGALALREGADGEVRAYTAPHPVRWGDGSRVLRQFGEFTYQIPVIAGVYGWSLWTQDEQLHEFSRALVSAYTISSLTTMALKGITDTQRPTDRYENGRFGFPSFHASSTFAVAAVIDEYYGPWAALPAYALGGAVSWSRIDQREHDLSDVFFGATLGFVIGRTVAAAHVERFTGIRVLPYYDPSRRSAGIVVEKPF